jgi:tRNA G18 (ribose-2'-O)-methylase SpoU
MDEKLSSMMGHEVFVLIHNIRSAYNVGSIFRTADGAGVSKIIISGYSARPPHKGVLKTALGAELTVPWEAVLRPGPWIKKMKAAGYTIVALEQTKKSTNIFSWRPHAKTVLIVGNEVRGVSPAIQRLADVHLEIPMLGEKESLNVASAFAIAAYRLGPGLTADV